jgi:hypothetical protein
MVVKQVKDLDGGAAVGAHEALVDLSFAADDLAALVKEDWDAPEALGEATLGLLRHVGRLAREPRRGLVLAFLDDPRALADLKALAKAAQRLATGIGGARKAEKLRKQTMKVASGALRFFEAMDARRDRAEDEE